MPDISIIIPCYNQGKYISACLDSVVKQTFQSWEAIVVNDGSTDNSAEIISAYTNKYPDKIKLISQNNQGVVIARNTAIAASKSAYIFPLDADDTIESDCLQILYNHRTNADVIYSKVHKFGLINEEFRLQKPTLWNMCDANQVPVSALYRKADWQKYGGYDTQMKDGWEDWEFWLNFIEDNKKFYCVPELLFNYRIQTVSRNRNLPKKKLKKYIYKKHPKVKLAYNLTKIQHFFFQKKIKDDCLTVKIFKFPIYKRKITKKR